MKKCLMILLTLTSAFTYAQTHLGVKGGINFTSIKPESGDNSDFKTGFHLGGLAHIHMDNKLALQPEITYSTHGGEFSNGTDYKLNLGYINVPILLQYMFNNGFRIQAGPQFGFLTSAKYKVNNIEVDVKDNYNSIDVSVPVGVSYVSNSGFGVDGRWLFGLSNIVEDDNAAEAKNQGAQVGLFYIFGHRKSRTVRR